jgi:hypothetical protein
MALEALPLASKSISYSETSSLGERLSTFASVVDQRSGGRVGLLGNRTFDLDEGEPNVGQRIPEDGSVLSQTVFETFHETRQRIDGQGGGFQIGRLAGEVDGAELEETHGVIGDNHVDRSVCQPATGIGQDLEGG